MSIVSNPLLLKKKATTAEEIYEIAKSIRFNSGDTPTITRVSPTSDGDRRTYTISWWQKKHTVNTIDNKNCGIISARTDDNNHFTVGLENSGQGNHNSKQSGTSELSVGTGTYKFADTMAWMHYMVVVDTTNGTQADRFKIYINGVDRFTSGGTRFDQHDLTEWNKAGVTHTIGASGQTNWGHPDITFADIYHIDGLALSPAVFGKFDASGVWVAIDPKDADGNIKLPAPNTNKTWSGMVSGTALTGQAFTLGFDGSITTGMEANSDTYATFTPTDPIVANHQIRISIYMRGSTPSTNYDLIVNGKTEFKEAHAVTGTNNHEWYTLNTRTLTSLRFGEDNNSARWMRIYAIEVDGIILVDGETDKTTISNPNKGLKWSDWLTANNSAGFQSNQGATNAFNGNFNNDDNGRCSSGWGGGSSDNGLKFSPPAGTITVNNKLELFTRNQRITVNGGSTLTTTTTTLGWKDLNSICPARPFNLTELLTKEHTEPESNAGEIFGIRVDGHVLLDKAPNNSFHLNFADTSSNAALGTSTLGDGSNPTVLRADGATASTDPNASYLLAALACNSTANLTDDKSTNANDFSKTDVDASTTASKFYGTSGKFTSGDAKLLSPTDTDYAAGTGKFTWELWFYLDKSIYTHGNTVYIVDMRDGGANGHQGYASVEYLNSGSGPTNSLVLGGSGTSNWANRAAINEDQWYHLACVREGTGSGELKFYLDGALYASETEAKDSDLEWFVIGNVNSYSSYSYGFPGYIQDFRYYKGIAKYTADFTPPAIGSFTVTNLTATDSSNPHNIDALSDSPTNNYCVFNPLAVDGIDSTTQGNLEAYESGDYFRSVFGSMGMSSGKWYFECQLTNIGSSANPNCAGVGVIASSITHRANTYFNIDAKGYVYLAKNGETSNNDAIHNTGYTAWNNTSDTVGVAFDADAGKIYFAHNNTWQGSSNPVTGANAAYTGLTDGPYLPGIMLALGGRALVNFGQRAFKYTAPSGFKALCTQNLPDTFSGDNKNNPSKYFDVLTFTGTGNSTTNTETKLDFQPDFLWFKKRNGDMSHVMYDAVRGTSLAVRADTNGGESAFGNAVVTPTSNGYTITGSNTGGLNDTSDNMVAWLWDAGTAGAANDNGTIDVSSPGQWANDTAGFSLTKYTGNGTTNSTVGHGLSATPDFIMCRNLDSSTSWAVWHSGLPTNHNVFLEDASVSINAPSSGYVVGVDNQVIKLVSGSSNETNVNANGDEYMMYCFRSVPGFSMFDTYVGNSDGDGPFCYCGFKPAFVIIKTIDNSGSSSWLLHDTARSPYNPLGQEVQTNNDDAEYAYTRLDILANGFKARTHEAASNNSGKKYLFCAWAEHPFKTSRAA